jgi:uncharacterized lipoprotein YddW (UPF0748 family)
MPTVAEVAAFVKAERPDVYEAVTGVPAWADQVGPEYRAAEATWLRWIEQNAPKF